MIFSLFAASAGEAVELCDGLGPPVEGPVVQAFAPTGRYSGHWGVDIGVPTGTDVKAAGTGAVAFVGTVAGNLTVTVSHGGGLRSSYSYLSAVTVQRGDSVIGSTTLGRSGIDHGMPALHFSVRVGSSYVDPLQVMECRLGDPSMALRLVPVPDAR